jgi:clan AA aspartic protease
MITGMVKDGKARIRLKITGPWGQMQEVEAVIDTGYTELLSLPPALVAALGLRWQGIDSATLADGSECFFDLYTAKITWDGIARHILVAELDTTPLVGMALLDGYELKVQVRPRGKVTIKQLPKGPKSRRRRR